MTTPDELVRLAWPDVGEEEVAAVAEVLASGRLTQGPWVESLERELASVCSVDHAVVVSSGTAALHLALLSLDLRPGDEVLVPAYTFPATANAVVLAGGRPVLVDVDAESMTIDVEQAAASVTPRTRACIGVHLFGRPLPWEDLVEALPERVALIEDAAGALGARRRGRPCGSLGAMGCLSFHPRKVVTSGEGGAVTTDDRRRAEAVRRLRNHGWQGPGFADLPSPGLNYRLSDVLAALALPQLRRLETLLAARRRVASGYEARLAEAEGILLPRAEAGDSHGWQAYVVQLERRDRALEALAAAGIEAQIGTFALHRLSAYADQGPFPGADRAYERALALPLHSRLTDSDLDRVSEVVQAVARGG